MKTSTIKLIKADLLADETHFPLLAVYKISRLFVNKDLIDFFQRLLAESKDVKERLILLVRLKKLVVQNPRQPAPTQLKAEADEFREFFKSIEQDQEFYEPIKWLDAEIECLQAIKIITREAAKSNNFDIENKALLNREEVLQLFKISKSTLNRRLAEGMPAWLNSCKLTVRT